MISPTTPHNHKTPVRQDHMVQAIPFSLAATKRVSVDFLSSGYLDVSVPLLTAVIKQHLPKQMGFPIQVSPTKLVRQLFGAYRSLTTPFFGFWHQGIPHVPLVS